MDPVEGRQFSVHGIGDNFCLCCSFFTGSTCRGVGAFRPRAVGCLFGDRGSHALIQVYSELGNVRVGIYPRNLSGSIRNYSV